MIGHVTAVNDDATVTVVVRGGVLPSLPTNPAYTPRAVGDRVEVEFRKGLAYVLGKRSTPDVDAPAAAPKPWDHTMVDVAPAGTFEEAASVWVDPYTREVRYVRLTEPPPEPTATTGTVSAVAVDMARYRSGFFSGGYMEQGTWGGYGPHTGLAVYDPGKWAELAGKTITAVRLDLHRVKGGGGVNAPVGIWVGYHNYSSLPSSASASSLAEVTNVISLNDNEPGTAALDKTWGERLRDSSAAGIGITHSSTNAEIDKATLHVDWST